MDPVNPERTLQLVAEALSSISGTWAVEDDRVVGPGTAGVTAREHRLGNIVHPDLGFQLNRDRMDAPVLWDCTVGTGKPEDEALHQAIQIWSQTTALAALELMTQEGKFATHIAPGDPQGFPGWHAIQAPILGWGPEDRGIRLQEWALSHPLLPALHASLLPALDAAWINGVKFFFGSAGGERFAEVQANGIHVPEATAELSALHWPTFRVFGVVRTFVILIHESAAH